MTKALSHYDVILLGSGFGASLLATILRRRGRSVAILERGQHPRFAIGESSTPTADFLLHWLAMEYDIPELLPLTQFGSWQRVYPQIACGCKRGFTYFWHGDTSGFRASDEHCHELLVTANASREVADTQWYRADVDHLFLNVARAYGVDYFDHVTIRSIEHLAPYDWHVSVDRQDKQSVLRAPFLIDGTGPSGILMRHEHICDISPSLTTNTTSVFGHWLVENSIAKWLGAQEVRDKDYPYPCQESTIHHLFPGGWLWQIGFENGVSSLGFVLRDPGAEQLRLSADEFWMWVHKQHPVLAEILGQVALCQSPASVLRTTRLQRLWNAGAGKDWAALPHTVGFVDPLHSTGIAHTLSGVTRLAEAMLATDRRDTAAKLEEYSRSVVHEIQHIDRLVAGCYLGLDDFRLFSTWSMLYFAAATLQEQENHFATRLSGNFLGANDPAFVGIVTNLLARLQTMITSHSSLDEQQLEAFRQACRLAIQPYNRVGLFAPDIPNIYWHTSAEKHNRTSNHKSDAQPFPSS